MVLNFDFGVSDESVDVLLASVVSLDLLKLEKRQLPQPFLLLRLRARPSM